MTSLLPTSEQPFGPLLSPLHHYILRTAEPIALSNAHQVAVIPLIPLGLQAYLLQHEGTRIWRMAVGVVGAALMMNASISYRFVQPELNAFNNGLGIAFLHLLIKYLEFALLKGPYVDGYVVNRGRSRWRSAFDLCINSRMVGLNVDLDHGGSIGTVRPVRVAQNGNGVEKESDGSVRVQGETRPVHVEHWLPRSAASRGKGRSRTRGQAMLRHARLGLQGLWIIDTLLALMHYTAGTTLGNPRGTTHAVDKFIAQNNIYLLPGTPLQIPAPRLLVETVITFSVGATVWQGLVGGYHIFALLALLTGYEVGSWEVDLMDSPWKADSLLDIWGRRWHQLFRHQFMLIANCILLPFGLAHKSRYITPLIFILSAAYHSLGELSMSPPPNIVPLSGFFILSGIGCGLEVTFKRLSGRRVSGWPGRIWTYAFLLASGRWACASWLDSGLAGSKLGFPGPGRWIVPLVADTLFKVVPK